MTIEDLKKLQGESTYGFINALVEAFPTLCARIEELESILKDSPDALNSSYEEGYWANSWSDGGAGKMHRKEKEEWEARREKYFDNFKS